MVACFLRRAATLLYSKNTRFLSQTSFFLSKPLQINSSKLSFSSHHAFTLPPTKTGLSPLLPNGSTHSSLDLSVELVDSDVWGISYGITEFAKENHDEKMSDTGDCSQSEESKKDANFDEIEDMRLRGSLFYKIDRHSREFEEYSLEFHRRNKTKKKKEKMTNTQIIERREEYRSESVYQKEYSLEETGTKRQTKKKNEKMTNTRIIERTEEYRPELVHQKEYSLEETGMKRQRKPTYNQLTDPYMEPFCLDIFISKSSARACIVHRVTSKVVVVAHSISKDLKRDLASTRNANACAAVGGILAQRAIADDIYNVVYTPRKGEKLEGKLQILLQSVIDHGVTVKVKIKQTRPKKAAPVCHVN